MSSQSSIIDMVVVSMISEIHSIFIVKNLNIYVALSLTLSSKMLVNAKIVNEILSTHGFSYPQGKLYF